MTDLVQRVMSVQAHVDAAAFERRRRLFVFASNRERDGEWRFTTRVACPACYSRAIRRSHRRSPREYLLSAFMLPFRCLQCGTRFFLSRLARV